MNIVLQSIILAESKENIQLKKRDRWQPCPAKHKARRRDTAGESLAAYQPTFTIMKKELIKQRKLYDDHEPAGELK